MSTQKKRRILEKDRTRKAMARQSKMSQHVGKSTSAAAVLTGGPCGSEYLK